MHKRLIHLKIKILNLAAESGIIRQQEQKALRRHRKWSHASDIETYRSLREHRKGIVRTVARENLLAYGFLRGRSYAQMEPSCGESPDFDAVKRIAKRFRTDKWEELSDQWNLWIQEAKQHLTTQVKKAA